MTNRVQNIIDGLKILINYNSEVRCEAYNLYVWAKKRVSQSDQDKLKKLGWVFEEDDWQFVC